MENRKNKRKVILRSALEIFERDGFYKAKVEEIAKGANVGKGTIYEYFDSKKDLFYKMVKNIMEEYFEKLQSVVQENVDPISKFENLLKLQLKLMQEHGNLVQVIQVETIKNGMGKAFREIFIDFRERQIALIEEVIKDGIESKMFKKVNTFMAALLFIGGVTQFAFEEIHGEDNNSRKKMDAKEFVATFIKGLIE